MVLADLPASAGDRDAAVVRVLSYNIRSLRDDREALVRVVRACAPDVLCVQEAPRHFRWRKAASWLARETGLVHTTGGATTAGPMLLTSLRAHVERSEDILLPRIPGLHQRGLATAVLRFGGGHRGADAIRLGVVSCHLSLAEAERHDQAGMVLDHLAALGVPYTVLAGDINDRPEGRAFRRLAGSLRDAWAAEPWGSELTYPQDRPRRRIDALFTTGGVEVLGCGVPAGLPGVTEADLRAASDHLPVLAALRLPRVSAAAPAGRAGTGRSA